MHKVGDYVLCTLGGVWKVNRTDNGTYLLQRHESGGEMAVPIVDDKEIIRGIASKECIQEAIDRVGFIPTIQAPNDKIRRELYVEALRVFDEVEWIKVIKSVYLRGVDERLMQGEEKYAEIAKS